MGLPERDPLAQLSLPPGFRFYPTDEELLVQYLGRKVAGHQFSLQIVAEIDLYKFDPWDLPSKALFGEKEWYFFTPRDRKYPNGSRPNRVAGSGYWKATGTDKVITAEGRAVGIKKALVFYVGKAPKGTKTNWIMHEYRLISSQRKKGSSRLDEWVLCRIYKKNSSSQRPTMAVSVNPNKGHSNNGSSSSSSSHFDDMLESLAEIDDRCFSMPPMNSLKTLGNDEQMGSRNLGCGNMNWASLTGLNSVPEGQPQVQSLGIPTYVNNDAYFPSVPPLCHVDSLANKGRNSVEEEVQSGFRTQRVENSGFFQPNPGVLTQNITNLADPFGFRYPTQPSCFGFRQ